MRHDVVREGAVPCLGATLGVDSVLRVAELVEQVEGFDAGDELALEERLADGGIQHEVVGVQFAAAIAATAVHVAVGRQRGVQARQGVAGGEAVLEVGGVERFEVVHLSLGVPPADVACGADVQRTFIILYVGPVVQGQGVDYVLLARRHACEHGVVNGVVIARVGVGLPRPVALLVDGAADVEHALQRVGSADVLGTVGIDAACRVVCHRLRRAAMLVVERGADVERLLMSVGVLVEIVNVGICGHVALQAGIALSDDERLAVIAPPDAVHQLCRAAVVACAEAEVVLAVLAHQSVRSRGVQEYGVLRGHRVYRAPLVVQPFVAHGQAQGNVPPLI